MQAAIQTLTLKVTIHGLTIKMKLLLYHQNQNKYNVYVSVCILFKILIKAEILLKLLLRAIIPYDGSGENVPKSMIYHI